MGRQQASTTNTRNPELQTFTKIQNNSLTTPNRHSLSGTSRWGLFGHENAAVIYQKLSSEMRDSFVGNMPVAYLFDEVLLATKARDHSLFPDLDFSDIWASVDETNDYTITYKPKTTSIMVGFSVNATFFSLLTLDRLRGSTIAAFVLISILFPPKTSISIRLGHCCRTMARSVVRST